MADDAHQDENSKYADLAEGEKRWTTKQFGFEDRNVEICREGDDITYRDMDDPANIKYTLFIGDDGKWYYTDIETGDSFYVEVEGEGEDEMDREEMETKFNGSFDITIDEGVILKDMIANLHFLSTTVYIVARQDAFFFLMISERNAVAQSSGTSKKTKAQASDDNTIYSIVKINVDKVNYKFNTDIDDPELRAETMIVMEVGGDILHG